MKKVLSWDIVTKFMKELPEKYVEKIIKKLFKSILEYQKFSKNGNK